MLWTLLLACATDTSALEAELKSTRAELDVLRARLNALQEKPPVVPGTVDPAEVTGPAGGPLLSDELERAQRRAIDEATLQANSERTDAVDEDLAVLEDDVDAQAVQLEAMNDAIDELTAIVNNHADLLDGLGQDVLALDRDLQIARELEPVLSVQDGQLRIRDVNVVLEQGQEADGSPKPNGRILTEPAVLPGR